jgi:flagellar hook-basal body complex protein FliE
MSDLRINPIGPPGEFPRPAKEIGGLAPGDGVPFGKIVKGVLDDAIKAEQEATVGIDQFAAGNINDVHDVVMAVSKANMAIQLLVQVRNGVLEAYQELARIQL